MVENVIGYTYECIFLAVHNSVFTYERQTVYVWVYDNAEVVAAFLHFVHNAAEVLLYWFGVMGEVACRFAVEQCIFHADLVEQFGQNNAANGVHSIYTHTELAGFNGFQVSQFECFHCIDVALVERVVLLVAAKLVYVGIVEIFLFCYVEHGSTVFCSEKFALVVQQFQCVPLARIVRSGDDDTTIGTLHTHGKLGGRGGCQTDIYDIGTNTHKCAAHNVLHHFARNACVASNNNL